MKAKYNVKMSLCLQLCTVKEVERELKRDGGRDTERGVDIYRSVLCSLPWVSVSGFL